MLNPLLILAVASTPMQVDGELRDWPEQPTELGLIARCTRNHVNILLTVEGPPVNLQGLDEPLHLALDWDNDGRTGWLAAQLEGADLEIIFSPKKGRAGRGLALRLSDGPTLTWDAADLVFAPTTASNQFEIRLPRKIAGGKLAAAERMPWSLQKADAIPVKGVLTTEVCAHAPTPILASALPESTTDAIRVVSWNLEFGNLIKQQAVVHRILAAINPDILLLQEIESNQRPEDIIKIIEGAVPEGKWSLALGPVSGKLRSGVATLLPSSPVTNLQKLSRRGETRRPVRVAAMTIDTPGFEKLLVCSVHLKCCGTVDGPEDMTRIAEILAMRRAIAEAEHVIDHHSLIIGGDLNLVGGELPLQLLINDGTALVNPTGEPEDLVVANAYQPDSSGSQTWQKSGQTFSPGRLDYMVYSPSLQATRALVFDTLDLPESALASMNLMRTDCGRASHHLPVIVDLIPNAGNHDPNP